MFASIGMALDDLAAVGMGEEESGESALESHATFEGNARAKARWFSVRLPGRLVIADDSGLEVDALDGAPGVHSKRWAASAASGAALDAANNAALLHALRDATTRTARFVSVVVATDGEREWLARGECAGRILEQPEGRNGFGYDPLFRSDELGESFGIASRERKTEVSHRGRAFRALVAQFAGASW